MINQFSFLKAGQFGPAAEIVKHPFHFIAFNFKSARKPDGNCWFTDWWHLQEPMEKVLFTFLDEFLHLTPADSAEFNILVNAMIAEMEGGDACQFLMLEDYTAFLEETTREHTDYLNELILLYNLETQTL